MKSNRMFLIVFALLATALIGSLVLNVILIKHSRNYARHFNATRLDPLALGMYSGETNQATTMDTNTKRVVFFGDSRAYQWPFPTHHDQVQFYNRGIEGQTSTQAALRFDAHIPPLRPDVIIIQVGVNDLSAIPWFPQQQADIIANCQANIAAIVTKARDLGATVILTTIFPAGPVPFEQRMFASVDVAVAIAEVNSYITALADEGVVIFDTAAVLADAQGVVREAYSSDYLHITPAGYDALNRELVRLLADKL